MRISVAAFLRLSQVSLRLLCAPVTRNDACLITLCNAKQIPTPVVASDGRLYDARALQHWLRSTANTHFQPHVVPGCPIEHVDIELWPMLICKHCCFVWEQCTRLARHACASMFQHLRARRMTKTVCIATPWQQRHVPAWARVLNFLKTQRSCTLHATSRFTHHPASPFVPVGPSSSR